MFSVAMPYYSEYNATRRKQSHSQTTSSKPAEPGPQVESNHNHNSSISSQKPPVSITDLLEPALEGPPSPERLRQLSKDAKRASHLNRGHGRRAASSGSSSLLSLTGEQSYDNMSLTRRSSNRSTTSRSPSRDRPDSVQVLGKNIFHRRGKSSKSRRDSSAPSSSGSSLYSAEITNDNTLATLKESLMPTIFSRRKPSRDDSAMQKKVQISVPFNFQHVTHTHRDQLVNIQRENRMDLASEFSTIRTPAPNAPGIIHGSESQDLYFPNFSSEEVNNQEIHSSAAFSRPPLLSRRTAPISGTRRLIKHVRSQEQIRVSPPRPVRPPRSPIEPTSSPTLPPVPPPRVSSRQSMRQDCDPLAATSLDRPQTSGGFRRPQPFSPDETSNQPPATSYGYAASPDLNDFPVDETRFSHALTTSSHVAWPLGNPSTPSFETPLPDVPEEEEQFVLTRRSRLSLASNNSSLRGSQSVPVLRALAQAQRPMSGASDTLGRVDESSTHQASQSGNHETGGAEISPIRESWEDDIDYCYEHEADANFDYEWERPSMDVGRENLAPPVQVALVDDELMEATPGSTAQSSPGMLSASRFDVPALSPVSQASTTTGHEATTPSSTLSAANNFSFPRVEKAFRPSNLRHSRSGSQASSFKESHGFTLSPSLLIPNDYHQQMLLSEAERLQEYPYDDEFLARSTGSIPYEDGSLSTNHHSPLMLQSRSSISTTTTNSTTISDSTGERHVSTNSTWTALTRYTSSTSLNKMAGSWSETADRIPETHLADPHDDSDQETTPPASKDTVPELTPFPSVPFGKKSLHKSHASESVVRDELPAMKSAETIRTRRPRARTTSMSAQAPPVGQYALFPRTYVKGNGDRI